MWTIYILYRLRLPSKLNKWKKVLDEVKRLNKHERIEYIAFETGFNLQTHQFGVWVK